MRIYTLPSFILTEKNTKVTDFGAEFQNLVDKMVSMMDIYLGVGLAAPQVGENIKLFVARHENVLYVIANPKIEWRSFDMENGIEGCLSVPRYQKQVERSNVVFVTGVDRYGKKLEIEAKGYLARIFQHEIDHLNGILIA